MPENERYPDESEEEYEARMKLQKVEDELGRANEGVDPAEGGLETGGLETGGLETGGLETGGLLPDPNEASTDLFGTKAKTGLDTGGLKTGGLKTGGLKTDGLDTGGLETGGLKTDGLETGGLETGKPSGEELSKPRQTAQEFGTGQRGQEKPETGKPAEEAPYRRKRNDEIGVVADRAERVRGRQKFADEIGGLGNFDKLSDEQKDRGLELGLQENDINKYFNKDYDRRRRR